MQELSSRLKSIYCSARERLITWYNAPDVVEGDCDCSIIGNDGRGCRKRNCLARTLTPASYARKIKSYNG